MAELSRPHFHWDSLVDTVESGPVPASSLGYPFSSGWECWQPIGNYTHLQRAAVSKTLPSPWAVLLQWQGNIGAKARQPCPKKVKTEGPSQFKFSMDWLRPLLWPPYNSTPPSAQTCVLHFLLSVSPNQLPVWSSPAGKILTSPISPEDTLSTTGLQSGCCISVRMDRHTCAILCLKKKRLGKWLSRLKWRENKFIGL